MTDIKAPDEGQKFKQRDTDEFIYEIKRVSSYGCRIKKTTKDGEPIKSFDMQWKTWLYHIQRDHYIMIEGEDNAD